MKNYIYINDTRIEVDTPFFRYCYETYEQGRDGRGYHTSSPDGGEVNEIAQINRFPDVTHILRINGGDIYINCSKEAHTEPVIILGRCYPVAFFTMTGDIPEGAQVLRVSDTKGNLYPLAYVMGNTVKIVSAAIALDAYIREFISNWVMNNAGAALYQARFDSFLHRLQKRRTDTTSEIITRLHSDLREAYASAFAKPLQLSDLTNSLEKLVASTPLIESAYMLDNFDVIIVTNDLHITKTESHFDDLPELPYNLGKFKINLTRLHFDPLSIKANDYYHPHIASGHFCMGSAESLFNRLMAEGRYDKACLLLLTCFESIGGGMPYRGGVQVAEMLARPKKPQLQGVIWSSDKGMSMSAPVINNPSEEEEEEEEEEE